MPSVRAFPSNVLEGQVFARRDDLAVPGGWMPENESGWSSRGFREKLLEVVDGADRLRVDITDEMVADNWLSVRWKGDGSGGLAGPVWLECVSE